MDMMIDIGMDLMRAQADVEKENRENFWDNNIEYKEIELAYKRYTALVLNEQKYIISSERKQKTVLGFYEVIDKEIKRLGLEKFKARLNDDIRNNIELPTLNENLSKSGLKEKLQEYSNYDEESKEYFKKSLFTTSVKRANYVNDEEGNMPAVFSTKDEHDIQPSEQVLTGDQSSPYEDAAQ